MLEHTQYYICRLNDGCVEKGGSAKIAYTNFLQNVPAFQIETDSEFVSLRHFGLLEKTINK